MKILHTSDWHLGITFEGISREEDHKFFLKWLIKELRELEIDVLIIAGDIFDQPQPSAEAHKIYFQFLFQLSQQTSVKKVVIVGGNHDSPARLDAPAELLKLLDVFVVGGLSQDLSSLSKYICPVFNKDGKIELVIAAAPFIHEYRLGVRTAFQTEKEILQSFKEKMRDLYSALADEAELVAQGVPLIATGHLACAGYESDDAPLEVHMVGTLGGLPKDIFDSRFSYIALGHIHRSYRVENSNAYYCGSPIPLSIKESKQPRCVQIISFPENNFIDPIIEKKQILLLRNIVEFKGTLENVLEQIQNLKWVTPASPILCIIVYVDFYTAGIDLEIRKKINKRFSKNPPILSNVKQIIKNIKNQNLFLPENLSLKDLTIEEVFLKMCESQNLNVEDDLLKAFQSLLSEENI